MTARSSPALVSVDVRPASRSNRESLAWLLHAVDWEDRYIDGQLEGFDSAFADVEHRQLFLAWSGNDPLGFVSVQLHAWNRLGQLQGLVVAPPYQRHGIASTLVQQAERFILEQGGRGIYVDTPVTNQAARAFYLAQGYAEDYTMTGYYDEGLDGVTCVKFFGLEAKSV